VPIPQVAIVGRPNVGKSSLFNWLAERRIAIVDPTPGVTRDRLTTLVKAGERYFEIVDTGGLGIEDSQNLTAEVEGQIGFAIDRAQVILFVVDARSGPVPLDEEVAKRLRGIDKPVLLVANKADFPDIDTQVAEFYKFGFGDILCVSAQQNRGKSELLKLILRHLPRAGSETEPKEADLKLAIVGRRNTGKSTFINALAQEPRTIVSEIPGTTRDSVDVRFEKDARTIIAIDTAGVRNKGKIRDSVEFYSLARAERSIRRADVVLHFFDATAKVSHVDKQLASYIHENFKPAIFVVNKWDLVPDTIFTGTYGEYLRKTFPSLDHVPIAFTTAKEGKNVQVVLNLAQNLFKQACARIGTGDLNRVVKQALDQQSPPNRQNRVPRIYYATQVAVQPPTIVLFTNGPQLFDNTYQRYLLKMFHDNFPFKDVAIKMYLREKATMADDGEATRKPRAKARARPRKGQPRKSRKTTGDLWKDV
jgi:GTPase